MTQKIDTIPDYVGTVSDTIQKAGFEAYLVGGCVRDILRGVSPRDFDIATNAHPEKIQELFPHTFYENTFGTVGVVIDGEGEVEVTTYRTESSYSDARHPDQVSFAETIEEDLKRRDFTMNAIALQIPLGERTADSGVLVDPYEGQKAISEGVIDAVGDAEERFGEDALRMLRAVRFSAELSFFISRKTGEAIQKMAQNIEKIAHERIRDEFSKILMSPRPKEGILLLRDLGLLSYVLPELEEGIDIEQGGAHVYNVFEHILETVQATAEKGWELPIRLAALFHDIGKPRTRETDTSKEWSFHAHDVVGARMAEKALERLRFPSDIVRTVKKLVRWHMFFADTEQITLSAVRRMIRNVGEENIWDLMNLRIADRKGMDRPKEEPYRFRKYKAMVEEALRDPISAKQLVVDGGKIMELTGEKPGPRIGQIMNALLEEVLDDPKKNTGEYLENRVCELAALPQEKLSELSKEGEKKREALEEAEVQKIRGKYFVQ